MLAILSNGASAGAIGATGLFGVSSFLVVLIVPKVLRFRGINSLSLKLLLPILATGG